MTDGAGMAERLTEICAELGPGELRMLLLVAERLRTGQRRYGRFDLAADDRDWHTESLEEVADALVYAACALMRGQGR
jgi:hypothetical protein